MKTFLILLLTCSQIFSASAQKSKDETPVQMKMSKVIVVKITSDTSGWKAEIIRSDYGAPTLNITTTHDVNLTAKNSEGKSIYQVPFDDPRAYFIDDGPGGENGKRMSPSGERYLMLPFDPTITTLEIKGVSPLYKDVSVTVQVADQIKKLK